MSEKTLEEAKDEFLDFLSKSKYKAGQKVYYFWYDLAQNYIAEGYILYPMINNTMENGYKYHVLLQQNRTNIDECFLFGSKEELTQYIEQIKEREKKSLLDLINA